jgi:hypothetical protein
MDPPHASLAYPTLMPLKMRKRKKLKMDMLKLWR